MRKLLRHHIGKPVGVLLALMTVLVGTAGTADATIHWYGIQLVDQASQECLHAGALGEGGVTVPSCMARGTDWWALYPANPGEAWDSIHGTYAQVLIQATNAPFNCLRTGDNGYGPNGPMSTFTTIATCSEQDPHQVWAMWTAAPPQNVGNPAGLKHFIEFYNPATHTCLDGGIGVYGFYSPYNCSKTNNWQIWNIYTNQTTS
ncbi:hypothetical protein [Actinoallomurus sp. NPDC050550]|uniref:hypothetical protein n=1 Tax=Actinoallomurus sp. NPDC050550 TaxID=3154937 RepID=UPI0033D2C3F1